MPQPRPARHRLLPRIAACAVSVASIALSACNKGALDTKSVQAERIANLWWLMFAIACAMFILVVVLLGIALFRRRGEPSQFERQPLSSSVFILGLGGVMPLIILAVVFGFTIDVMAKSNDATKPLEIDVVGHQWWWEVHYPDGNVVTANEIHIPTGRDVEFHLTSADVIHSFWVPQLGGKTDLIPGQEHTFIARADDAGTFRGQCAEFCGLQHAHMALDVVADAPDQYEQWVQAQRAPSFAPASGQLEIGQQVFLSAACVYCHAVSGTNASGTLGPNLSHLASRGMIASGALENTPENLAAWITNPQESKPGTQMPPTHLKPDSMQALIDYLESLK
jgi:cytochrome c oxidase subunit 2